ncbi:MAG: hypothetical protein A2Z27_03355 [candidate division Zixibacteria bacterium RBG_16_50_21]|nr:MAG: hypothetical protein A2Z27_03355 [candidate division Zixibacteria bacterium RBG_16_50_21]
MEDLLLEVETRKRIFDMTCKYPGIHMRELSRNVGLRPTLVDYHLLQLEKRGFIYSMQDGQFKRYFPNDFYGVDRKMDLFDASDKPLVGLLRQRIPFCITVLLLRHEASSNRELSEFLRRRPSTISYHLHRLIEAGVVEQKPGERGYCLVDAERIERILMLFTPLPQSLTEGFLRIWEDLEI